MELPPPAGTEPVAEAREVTKRYRETLAVDGVTLAIRAGQSLALVGRNGAGKSTLVRMLTGLDRPDTGEIRFSGERAPDASARAQWPPQYQCPSTSTPWPMTCTRQCSQMGAMRWMAQEKQSKTCTAPCACTSNDMP